MKTTKKPKVIYLVWQRDSDDTSYYCQYDTIVEAIEAHENGVEIFSAEPKSIGHWEKKISVELVAPKKLKKKAKKK